MNSQNEQLTDNQLAAYALGALDADEVLQVEQQLRASEDSRAELEELRDVVALLPYAVQPFDPPARIHRQLFARIAADQASAQEMPNASPVRRAALPAPQRVRRVLTPILAITLIVMIVGLGVMTYSLQTQVQQLAGANQELTDSLAQTRDDLAQTKTELAEAQQTLAQTQDEQQVALQELAQSQVALASIETQITQERQAFTFVTAPGVATRELIATSTSTQAGGEMYMRPGHSEAVIFFQGLPPLTSGQVYVFWLADGQEQIAAGQVMVDADGLGLLLIQAPQEVNAFEQVMLTVESSVESKTPSDDVLLEGLL